MISAAPWAVKYRSPLRVMRFGSAHSGRIARALEPYDILWLEEIMPPDNPEAFVRIKSATKVPLCQSE